MATKIIDQSGATPGTAFTTAQTWATYMSGLPDLTAPEIAQFVKGTYSEGRIFLNGPVTTAANYVLVQAYPGSEHKGVTGTGVVLEDGTGSSWGVLNPEANCAHIKLQDIEFDDLGANGEYAVHYSGTVPADTFLSAERCIFNTAGLTNSAMHPLSATNCIAFDTLSFFTGNSANLSQDIVQYCTFIMRSPYVAITGVYGVRDCLVTNCVVMNYGGLNGYLDFLTPLAAGCDYNASRDTSAPGAHSITGLLDSDQFSGVGDGSWDFRPKTGSALIGAGTPISGVTTDIAGNTRSATTPTIGAFEFVTSGGTTVTITSAALALAAKAALGNIVAPVSISSLALSAKSAQANLSSRVGSGALALSGKTAALNQVAPVSVSPLTLSGKTVSFLGNIALVIGAAALTLTGATTFSRVAGQITLFRRGHQHPRIQTKED